MYYSIEAIIFYILIIDAVGANIVTWSGNSMWFNKKFRLFARFFPVTRGWTTLYLALVLFIGYLIFF